MQNYQSVAISYLIYYRIDLSDLQEITSTCTPYDVTEECVVVEFARKHKMSYKPTSGCGYFEFTKPEYISPDTNIILLHKVHQHYYLQRVSKTLTITSILLLCRTEDFSRDLEQKNFLGLVKNLMIKLKLILLI